ncbi:SDR family oxidoreductase [Litoribrevibacter albus]|uniref:NmrA family protein n=1 Tax=Litoribrevibacter albus TaxID=1473156 RepID=A0AA37S8P2_9GAMM|nr:SDR family oxidoreductase [Litoribrevibacter albus]GLQ30414.1 NmrA family protein [Litoribrevibacter albus]
MILVIGATGKTGSKVCEYLSNAGLAYKALTRDADKAKSVLPESAQIVQGDLSDKSHLYRVLEDVTHVYMATPPDEHMVVYQNSVIDVARDCGVKRIVKLSGLRPSLNSEARLPRLHAQIEEHLKESGVAYSMIRSNLFMQVLFGDAESVKTNGKIYAPASNGKISFTDIHNIAEVALKCLQDNSSDNHIITVTGEGAESYEQVATYLTQATGKDVEYIPVSFEDARQSMIEAGYGHWLSDALIELFQIYSANDGCFVSDDFETLTGKPASSLESFIQMNKQAFC